MPSKKNRLGADCYFAQTDGPKELNQSNQSRRPRRPRREQRRKPLDRTRRKETGAEKTDRLPCLYQAPDATWSPQAPPENMKTKLQEITRPFIENERRYKRTIPTEGNENKSFIPHTPDTYRRGGQRTPQVIRTQVVCASQQSSLTLLQDLTSA